MTRFQRSTILVALMVFAVIVGLLMQTPPKTSAANFSMQTGYYIGTGSAGLSISGIGFQPDFVMIKSSTAAGVAVFKTSAMPANTTAFTSATADDTGTNVALNANGFTLGTLANVNSANVLYYWIAIGGSDCSATGNFCVGSYTGNGASPRNITTGFQPTMTMVKRSTAVLGHFRTASEPANETLFFDGSARDTGGAYISGFGATFFTVGATDNANTATYYYAAFKTTANSFTEGTYTGNATDRDITAPGFRPNFVMVKNATGNNAANRQPLMNFSESYGDSSAAVANAAADVTDGIEELLSNGFNVGTSNPVNRTGNTIYYFAFGGAANHSTSGSFAMATGSYSGTGASNPITGLGFRPELVIIKANTAQLGVFRTSLMFGDSTAHMSAATANFAGGITSLDNDGFTVGTATQTNSSAVTYHWQAFDGAFNPYTNSGVNDFAIGAYYGNGIDARDIIRMPWQPDMVTIKRNAATVAAWRPSSQAGDNTSFFGATAQTADYIQTFNADGFEVGTNAAINTAASLHYWFAFKEGSNFAVGSYTGTGTAQNITDAGMRAENVWIKRSTAVNGVMRPVSLSGDNTQYFVATANVNDRITSFVKGGFRVGGAQTETNTNTGTYYYAAWNNPNHGSLSVDIVDASGNSVASPSFAMNSLSRNFNCTSISGSLGSASQLIRISNLTTNAGWSLSIAATGGAGELWRNIGDTEQYDFNESSGSPAGCNDGADTDSKAGKLTINPSGATIAPETGCTTTNVSLGGSNAFNQDTLDAVGIISASSSASPDCIWDVSVVGLSQLIPREQAIGNYSINMTITVVAN